MFGRFLLLSTSVDNKLFVLVLIKRLFESKLSIMEVISKLLSFVPDDLDAVSSRKYFKFTLHFFDSK